MFRGVKRSSCFSKGTAEVAKTQWKWVLGYECRKKCQSEMVELYIRGFLHFYCAYNLMIADWGHRVIIYQLEFNNSLTV